MEADPVMPAGRTRSKQVPEKTITDECKYCGENEPEWSTDAKCWIHRRASLDKRCTRKIMGPCGEMPIVAAEGSQPSGPTPDYKALCGELIAAIDAECGDPGCTVPVCLAARRSEHILGKEPPTKNV